MSGASIKLGGMLQKSCVSVSGIHLMAQQCNVFPDEGVKQPECV